MSTSYTPELAIPYGWTVNEDPGATAMDNFRLTVDAVAMKAWGTNYLGTSGLVYAYYGGNVLLSTGPVRRAGGTLNLTANATNYIERTANGDTVSANTTGFTLGKIPMSKIVCGTYTATTIEDWRPAVLDEISTTVPIPVASGGTGLTSLGTSNQVLGVNSGATDLEYKTISGTSNRVTVTHSAGGITLSSPQDIHTSASPQFAGIGVGAAYSSARAIYVETSTLSTSSQHGVDIRVTGNSSAAGGFVLGFQTIINLAAGSYNVPNIYGYVVNTGSVGAGASVTNTYAYYASSSTNGASGNIGFYTNQTAGTGNFAFKGAGTAPSSFGGPVTCVDTTEATSHTAAGTMVSGGLAVAKRICSPKMFITEEGGFAVRLTAGENLNRGEIVYIPQSGTGNDGEVRKAPTSSDMPVGVVFQNASAAAEVVVITSGIAYVLPESGKTAARGNVLTTSSSEAGRADFSSTTPVSEHWRECGHFLDTGSGNGVLTRALVHFN